MRRHMLTPLLRLLYPYRLAVAIGLVVVVSLLLTTISMTLYVTDGTSGLDLSRPSSEQARKALKKDVMKDFPATGTLSDKDYEAFMQLYTTERDKLKSYSNFRDATMTDASLGLDESTIIPDNEAIE